MPETANEAGSPPEVTAQPTETPEVAAPDPSEKPADPNVTANGERLDRQTRNWRALETDRDHWRELALRFSQQPQASQPAAPEPAKTEPTKTLADFEYDESKYAEHLRETLRTSLSQEARAAAKAELAAERERQAAEARKAGYRTRVNEFAKTVEDFDEVAGNPRLAISPDMAEVIQESDDGPALAYYLGKNPDVADKIAQLPPKAAARELGKIEARLAFEREKAKSEKVSKAPPPPPKVDGTAEVPANVKPDSAESDSLSDQEWTRRRNKQLARRSN